MVLTQTYLGSLLPSKKSRQVLIPSFYVKEVKGIYAPVLYISVQKLIQANIINMSDSETIAPNLLEDVNAYDYDDTDDDEIDEPITPESGAKEKESGAKEKESDEKKGKEKERDTSIDAEIHATVVESSLAGPEYSGFYKGSKHEVFHFVKIMQEDLRRFEQFADSIVRTLPSTIIVVFDQATPIPVGSCLFKPMQGPDKSSWRIHYVDREEDHLVVASCGIVSVNLGNAILRLTKSAADSFRESFSDYLNFNRQSFKKAANRRKHFLFDVAPVEGMVRLIISKEKAIEMILLVSETRLMEISNRLCVLRL